MEDEQQANRCQAVVVGAVSLLALFVVSQLQGSESPSPQHYPLLFTAAAAAFAYCCFVGIRWISRTWSVVFMISVYFSVEQYFPEFKNSLRVIGTCVPAIGSLVVWVLICCLSGDAAAQDVLWPIACVLAACLGPITADGCRPRLERSRAPLYVSSTVLMVCFVGLVAAVNKEIGRGYPTAYGDVHGTIWKSTEAPALRYLKENWISVRERFADSERKPPQEETFDSTKISPVQADGSPAAEDDHSVVKLTIGETTFHLLDESKQQRLTSISVLLAVAVVAIVSICCSGKETRQLTLWFALVCGFFALNATMCCMVAVCGDPVVIWGKDYGNGCIPVCALPLLAFLVLKFVILRFVCPIAVKEGGQSVKTYYFEDRRDKPSTQTCIAVLLLCFIKVVHEFAMRVVVPYAATPALNRAKDALHAFRPKLKQACDDVDSVEASAACDLASQNCYLCAALSAASSTVFMAMVFMPQKSNLVVEELHASVEILVQKLENTPPSPPRTWSQQLAIRVQQIKEKLEQIIKEQKFSLESPKLQQVREFLAKIQNGRNDIIAELVSILGARKSVRTIAQSSLFSLFLGKNRAAGVQQVGKDIEDCKQQAERAVNKLYDTKTYRNTVAVLSLASAAHAALHFAWLIRQQVVQ